ncbi:MAG: hypothetical protein JNM22_06225 [Saprospiraceae bacterium]|nr:hypothetical protein [Saprospiraceae bacterium]
MKKIYILLALVLPVYAWSQTTGSLSLGFQLPVALGEFRETSDADIGAGARFNFYVRPTPSFPLQPGLDIGLFGRGNAGETIPINVAGTVNDYKVKTSNNVFSLGLLLKFEPFQGKRFSPYLEGELGANDFFSQVQFYQKNRGGRGQIFGKNEDTKERWGFFYGGSAGVKIALGKKRDGGIELKCAYLRGANTSYNAKPRYSGEGVLILTRLTSTTHMLVPQIGAWISFKDDKNNDSK